MTSFSAILDVSYTGGCSSPRLQNHRQDSNLKFPVPELLEYPSFSAVAMGFEIYGVSSDMLTNRSSRFPVRHPEGEFWCP